MRGDAAAQRFLRLVVLFFGSWGGPGCARSLLLLWLSLYGIRHGNQQLGCFAERAGRVVGLVHFLYHRSTSQIAMNCYLQDLFTSPDARGGGVGRRLIEAVYERARASGAARVYWLTHNTNATARRLYDQVADDSGFVVYRKAL